MSCFYVFPLTFAFKASYVNFTSIGLVSSEILKSELKFLLSNLVDVVIFFKQLCQQVIHSVHFARKLKTESFQFALLPSLMMKINNI